MIRYDSYDSCNLTIAITIIYFILIATISFVSFTMLCYDYIYTSPQTQTIARNTADVINLVSNSSIFIKPPIPRNTKLNIANLNTLSRRYI